MKRMILIATALLIVFAAVACAESNAACPAYCTGVNFVDENNDGVCDCFADTDGDGVCDGQHEHGCSRHMECFVDENGDGVCDQCRLRKAGSTERKGANVRHEQHGHGRAHSNSGRRMRVRGGH